DLSVRVYNSLRRVGVKTVGDLLQLKENGEITRVRYIGEKGIKEIEEKIDQYKFVNIEGEEVEFINLSVGVNKNVNNLKNHVQDEKPEEKLKISNSLILELSKKVKLYNKVIIFLNIFLILLR
ncbi:MAG: DNA-directed RNA polymerase subunit alpha C-terminal domain-containing protein, partial [Bacteroidales bacterium]